MRAAVCARYGSPDVLRIVEQTRPRTRHGEVLVRIRSAAVTSADARIRAARFPAGFGTAGRLAFGMTRPRRAVLGTTFAGDIEALGDGVDGFNPQDAVCGMTGMRLGAHAEYVAVAADRIVRMPAGVDHDQAAGVLFGGTTALYFLRDQANLTAGMTVLINGASGAIGTNAVQLAAHAGAHVTALTSTGNVALSSALGAERVIDYTRKRPDDIAERFDVVFDTVGTLGIDTGRRLLGPDGTLLLAVASLAENLRARGNVRAGSAPERAADFATLLGLIASGELTVTIDGVYDLDDIAEAHRRVDTGHKVGNVLIHP